MSRAGRAGTAWAPATPATPAKGLSGGSCGYLGRACLEHGVFCLAAACIVMRADVFRQLGGLDQDED